MSLADRIAARDHSVHQTIVKVMQFPLVHLWVEGYGGAGADSIYKCPDVFGGGRILLDHFLKSDDVGGAL